MFLLQALAFLVGLTALFATAFTLLPEVQLHSFGGEAALVLMCAGIVLFSAGYFFFAIAGYRTVRSVLLRCVAGVLVLYQLGAGGAMIFLYPDPVVLGVIAPLLCFSVFMFVAFVWPATRNRAYRPLRRRERPDEVFPRK